MNETSNTNSDAQTLRQMEEKLDSKGVRASLDKTKNQSFA